MKAKDLLHLFKWELTTKRLRDAQPGVAFKDITLASAVSWMNMTLINEVVKASGIRPLTTYSNHLKRTIEAGDAAVECLRFLLLHRQELTNNAFEIGAIPWQPGHLQSLRVILDYQHYWSIHSKDSLRDKLVKYALYAEDEEFSRLWLEYDPSDACRWVFCNSIDLAGEIVRHALKPSSGSLSGALCVVAKLYRSAVKRNNLELMQFLHDLKFADGEAILNSDCFMDPIWFAYDLVRQELTPERKEVLIQAMAHMNLKQDDRYNYVLYLINDQDLLEQPTPTVFSNPVWKTTTQCPISRARTLSLIGEFGIVAFSEERLREFVNEHLNAEERTLMYADHRRPEYAKHLAQFIER